MTKNDIPTLEILTERDREVLSLLITGLDNREIAERLDLHYQTVRNRVSGIYKKLGLPGRRTGLLLWAYQHGYQDPSQIAPWLEIKMQLTGKEIAPHP